MQTLHASSAEHYRAAAEQTKSLPERDYLRMKAAAMRPDAGQS